MLEFLRGRASERKLRLFACACCRRLWDSLRDERSRRAVETVERYASGLVSDEELLEARRVAHSGQVHAHAGDDRDAAGVAETAVGGQEGEAHRIGSLTAVRAA